MNATQLVAIAAAVLGPSGLVGVLTYLARRKPEQESMLLAVTDKGVTILDHVNEVLQRELARVSEALNLCQQSTIEKDAALREKDHHLQAEQAYYRSRLESLEEELRRGGGSVH